MMLWAVLPTTVVIIATGVFLSNPSKCEGSITDRICSSVTNFLNKESSKADTAVKDCKEKCDWTKKKQKLIAAAQKKANDSCDKGIAPDISEISKGLDKTAIEKLNKLYNTDGSKMFDGTEELSAKDFNVNFNQTSTLTGAPTSGNVMSLKSGTPDIGTLGKSVVTPIALTTSAEGSTCDTCPAPFSQKCLQICCDEKGEDWCDQLCSMFKSDPRCKTDNWFMKTMKAIWGAFVDLYHWVMGHKKCNENYYSPKKEFCENGEIYEKCGGEVYNSGEYCCVNGKTTGKCGVECYNPEAECCKNEEVYSDKIENLLDCPSRYQKIALPTDGTCGSGALEPFTPDNPTGGENTSFLTPCYMHDRDYSTCKKNPSQTDEAYRAVADNMFFERMEFICEGDDVPVEEKLTCGEWAGIYHAMVQDGGSGPYESAQLKYCKCCPIGALP